MEIAVTTIAEGHERVVRDIVRCGEEIVTEDGEITIEWPPEDPYVIRIERPFEQPMVSDVCRFGEQMMDAYVDQLLKIHPPGPTSATYYYSNRLFDYPQHIVDSKVFDGNGDGMGIEQVARSIIQRLYKTPNSRRAIAITWVPVMDIDSGEPPCLQLIQCFVRDNKLHMVCYFRSNDMLSAWGANAYGLAHLMKYICESINISIYADGMEKKLSDAEAIEDWINVGTLTTISASAHIYWKRDKQELDLFRRKLNV